MTPSSPDPLTAEAWAVLNRILDESVQFGHHIKGDPDEGEWHCTCGDENEWNTAEQHIAEVVFRGAFPFRAALAAQPAPAPGLEATEALPEDAPITFDRRSLYAEGWADRGDAIRATLTAQARPPADEGLRAALRTADERARELTEYHVPNVHTSKTGRATVDSIETEDGRTIVVCAGCGQEYPCDSRELADMVLLAALAAQPAPAPGLDVEWLAEALWESSDNSEEGPWIDASEDQRATALEWTRAIVAEYARLSKDSTDDPE